MEWVETVLRIRDVYLGSRILIFDHPGSWIWVWDPGSEIRKKTYSGPRIQGSIMHRIPDPQHYVEIDYQSKGLTLSYSH
jgi:hypothetical protein